MLRVGFVGCGDVAARRAQSMRALNERGEPVFEVVAACDLAPLKSEGFIARFGGAAGSSFSSLPRMLGEVRLDALWICTPPSARGAAENAALAAGVALWIEPPIAANIRTANALAVHIKKSAVPVSVGAPHRYSAEIERLRRVLSAKSAPKIERWNGDFAADLSRAAWRSDPKNGSIWLDGGWPLLDLMRFLGVEADTSRGKSAGANGMGVAALETKSGALATLGVSRFEQAREVLDGRGAQIHLAIHNWTGAPHVELEIERETTIWNGDDCVTRQLEAFARLLTHGKRTENRSPFADALLTLKFALELDKKAL